jgi:predicted RNase H-like HicB family nuclease
MRYVYPAVFTPVDGDGYDVAFPDLPYCRTCGADLAEAMMMAEDAAAMWLWDAENSDEAAPKPSPREGIACDLRQFVNLVKVDTDAYRRAQDTRAVKKTLTIPAWLNAEAEKAHLNFSGVLQEALKQRLDIAR